MKQRFSTLDVLVISRELSSILPGHRVSNIYDLSSRIFLFKFAKPGSPIKHQLLVDCGFRCHLTNFSRIAASAPSAFVTKLRRVLKGRRVTSVRQVGWDRVIEIRVGDGEGERKVFVEFFAAGNIVVTDRDLNVAAVWREVREGDEKVDVKLGGKYRTDVKQGYPQGLKDEELAITHSKPSSEEVREALVGHMEKMKAIDAGAGGGKKAKKGKGQDDLKRVLAAKFAQYPTHLLEHIFKTGDFDSLIKPQDLVQDETKMAELMGLIEVADGLLRHLAKDTEAKGYIIAKIKERTETEQDTAAPDSSGSPSREDLLYDDFHPFKPSQFQGLPDVHILTIDGFNAAVDEFYSSLESQKLTSRLTEREETAKRKLETAKAEHEKRLGALQQVQELHIRKAQAIEANTHRVEEACAAVNGLIAQGMDWMDIGKLIENEQGRNNQVASLIRLPLKLYENTVTLILDEPGMEDADSDSDEGYDTDEDSEAAKAKEDAAAERRQTLPIDIDLAQSPWANARQYYDQKKTAAEKEKKTVEASSKALKSTERKIEADLKKGLKQEKPSLRAARRQFFFEKFHYFISSDGYLVLGGKDPAQNEILYRRYLKRGDVYVHADLHGATSVIVKNNPDTPDAPIPPSTLSQAGALVVCTSSAWDSKAVMAAWWVNAEQVSKTVKATRQYLSKDGDFNIDGVKNFLPPSQLLLGFGLTWLIRDDDRVNHGKLRVGYLEKGDNADLDGAEGQMSNMSIQDGANEDSDDGIDRSDQLIADVEDAAAEEVQEDVEADREIFAKQDDDEEDEAIDEDDDDHISVTASEAGYERSNPLQSQNSVNFVPPTGGSVLGRNHEHVNVEADQTDATEEDESDHASEEDEGHNEEHNEVSSVKEDLTEDKSLNSLSPSTQPPTATIQSKSKPTPRGKLSKAARAKQKKYANQDEEDRQLALELLGSTKKQQQQRSHAEAARKEREEQAERDKERRRKQHDRGVRLERERRERMELSQEHGGDQAESNTVDENTSPQDLSDLSELGLLVPVPHPSDHVLAAVPTVAPWSALSRHKYKVKLQPGSLKKGKAVKEILGMWLALGTRGPRVVDESNNDKEKVWRSEVDRIKEIRMEEVVGVVPVKGVRVVRSGGAGGAAGGGSVVLGGGGGGKGRGGAGGGRGRGKKR